MLEGNPAKFLNDKGRLNRITIFKWKIRVFASAFTSALPSIDLTQMLSVAGYGATEGRADFWRVGPGRRHDFEFTFLSTLLWLCTMS